MPTFWVVKCYPLIYNFIKPIIRGRAPLFLQHITFFVIITATVTCFFMANKLVFFIPFLLLFFKSLLYCHSPT